ncbi:uncharacterized protein LOC101847520 [Aplysia californica]|uniref:Uncharacterized protein LOC101847520 n=1 Tax=Aplysia californica TaxID=6500 RepID=A0ABM1A764_APLCA|nr:uncharacterized protein LOC101847520 [Aplysia californica]
MNWNPLFSVTVLLVCCFSVVDLAEDNNEASSSRPITGILDYQHVMLGPPGNLTVLYTGETNVVVAWDPPVVYHAHDINDTEVTVTALTGSYVAENVSQTNESAASDPSSESNMGDVTVSPGDSTDSSEVTPSAEPANRPELVCQPQRFFSNYTVGLDSDPKDAEGYRVIQFRETEESMEKKKVTLRLYNKIVPYNEGCLTEYEVMWKVKDARSAVKSMKVPPTFRQANITGLEPGMEYWISVKATYLSGDSYETQKKVFINTWLAGENKTCQCDMFGAVLQDCKADHGPQYCKCKTGYTGPFCEVCQPGYYRTAPYYPCHRCPCNEHATRTATCSFREGFLQCDQCETGYRGNICHLCDKNYYRSRGRCVPCFCNGHTPVNATHMCKRIIGECLDCQHNTTGFHCERCLPGYKRFQANNYSRSCVLIDSPDVLAGRSSSSVSPGVIGAVIVAVLLLVALVVGALWLRRNRGRRANWKFWTVEMKRDQDDVDFNSVHNDDAHMDDIDDLNFYERVGKGTSSNAYARLHEDF